jgi:hypothetical protein
VDDTLAEGDRTVTISHTVISEDRLDDGKLLSDGSRYRRYDAVSVRNVEVLIRDDDRPGIVVTEIGTDGAEDGSSVVLEGQLPYGQIDRFTVVPTVPVTGTVVVELRPEDGRVILSSSDLRFTTVTAATATTAGVYRVTFKAGRRERRDDHDDRGDDFDRATRASPASPSSWWRGSPPPPPPRPPPLRPATLGACPITKVHPRSPPPPCRWLPSLLSCGVT